MVDAELIREVVENWVDEHLPSLEEQFQQFIQDACNKDLFTEKTVHIAWNVFYEKLGIIVSI